MHQYFHAGSNVFRLLHFRLLLLLLQEKLYFHLWETSPTNLFL